MCSLVSVIIPIYNAEKYLMRCLDSILNQSYTNIELIMINDGSIDSSEEICKKINSNKLKIKYFKQDNSGVSVARNKGLELATGEYILFVDSDDYLSPNAIKNYVDIAQKENADITILESKTLVKNGEQYSPAKQNEALTTEELKNKILLDQIGNHVIVKLFKRSLFQEINFPEGLVYEDLYVMPHLIKKANKIIYKCRPVYYYNRTNDSSLTSAGNDNNSFHRYSKALAYMEHENVAEALGKEDIVLWSIKKALHEIGKTFYINVSNKSVDEEALEVLKKYILKHKPYINILPFKDRVFLKSILNDGDTYKIYGLLYFVIKHK